MRRPGSVPISRHPPTRPDSRSAPPQTPLRPSRGAPDWRGLLDLFDGQGRGVLRRPVADNGLPATRTSPFLTPATIARARYHAVVAAAGDWRLPQAVRDALRAWRFDDANRLLGAAEAVPHPAN